MPFLPNEMVPAELSAVGRHWLDKRVPRRGLDAETRDHYLVEQVVGAYLQRQELKARGRRRGSGRAS